MKTLNELSVEELWAERAEARSGIEDILYRAAKKNVHINVCEVNLLKERINEIDRQLEKRGKL